LAGLNVMMGHRQVEQAALFYEFSLERHIQADHLLRSIDRFVDLEDLRRELAPFYSNIGRPSIDPELMIRMLLIGYCFGIRSERRLCDEVHLNLAYRWFCRLGLDGAVPDHSTFSKNRHGRFRESDLFRRVFETVLRRCIRERLVGGEGFAVDASLIKADANRQKGIEGDKGLPPEAAGRAIDEYLAVLDDAAFGAATAVTPKFVSPSDPAARWTGAHGGQAFFAYSTNYLVDVENAIIVDVEATTAIRQAEVLAAKRMIERSLERFDLYPSRLLGDSAYGSAEMLGWLVYEHGIEPHVTVFDKSARTDGTFSREVFAYDHAGDVYRCPGGKTLTTTGTPVNNDTTILYRASKYDCQACSLKSRCCPNTPARKVPRSIYEGARDMAREIASSWEGRTATKGTERRTRRVHPCCSSSESSQDGETDSDARTKARVNPTRPTRREPAVVRDGTTAAFFNGIGPKLTFTASLNSPTTGAAWAYSQSIAALIIVAAGATP
jgi:transposase